MDTQLLANLYEQRKLALFDLGRAYYEVYKCSLNIGCDHAEKDDEDRKEHRRKLGQRVDEAAREVLHMDWLIAQVKEGKFHASNTD